MKEKGIEIKTIIEVTGLSEEELKEIQFIASNLSARRIARFLLYLTLIKYYFKCAWDDVSCTFLFAI